MYLIYNSMFPSTIARKWEVMRSKLFKLFFYYLAMCVFGIFYGLLLHVHGVEGILAQFTAPIYAPVLLPIIFFTYLTYKAGNKILAALIIVSSIALGYVLGMTLSH